MFRTIIKNIFTKIKVIARALPTDKSRMVKIGQSLNRVIGMTGKQHCPVL